MNMVLSTIYQVGDVSRKMADTNSVISGLTSAKNEALTVVMYAVNYVVVPLIAIGIGVAIIFAIAACVRKHSGQQSYTDKLIVIAVCVIAMALVISFPAWGWEMMGVVTA